MLLSIDRYYKKDEREKYSEDDVQNPGLQNLQVVFDESQNGEYATDD